MSMKKNPPDRGGCVQGNYIWFTRTGYYYLKVSMSTKFIGHSNSMRMGNKIL